MSEIERESMEFDVVIVGAGPAGLRRRHPAEAAQSRALRRRAWRRAARSAPISCPAPSSTPSASIGCCPIGAKRSDHPFKTPVTDDHFLVLGPAGALRLPNFLMPPLMNNHGNYIVSLGNVCRWLADQGRGAGRRNLSGLCRAPTCSTTRTAP